MIIKPIIKYNVHLTSHPLGIKEFIKQQIDYVKKQDKITNPPRIALVVGSSSGYGLASRISLAFGGNTFTIGVSTGGGPKGKRTGKAGFWNTHWFNYNANKDNIKFKNFVGDAFSHDLKAEIIAYLKEHNLKIDLLVYSLASGVRTNPDTKEKIISALKPINQEINTYSIDIATKEKTKLSIGAATKDEIANTIYTMGGGDWEIWINQLLKQDLLSLNFKTIAYTYIGGEITKYIYRNGTIGEAKKDLENTSQVLNEKLKNINGNAYISVSKAIVSKASVFIPYMVVYGSCLFNQMLKAKNHETVIAHKYRLFKDILYSNNLKNELDIKGRIRLDKWEMDDNIQKSTIEKMQLFTKDYKQFLNLPGTKLFLQNFYRINGFGFENVDYQQEIDVLQLLKETNQ